MDRKDQRSQNNQHSRLNKNKITDELNPDDFDQKEEKLNNGRIQDDITDELNPDDFDQER
ncbi:hypothetical protein [Piscibacillus salipiscarius]|uniref:Uncharacterized protein n=1 Tax=Piscibacillus salipiscarius TaxID=299480 RepID=A0ABW5QC29_9BACI|nr:hypothetical protein [Piscibacillus salipiscarius]